MVILDRPTGLLFWATVY